MCTLLTQTFRVVCNMQFLGLNNNPVSEQTEQTMQIANRNGLEVLF